MTDRPAPESEVNGITLEMIEAGTRAVLDHVPPCGLLEGEAMEVAIRTYGAMANCRAGVQIVPESLSYMQLNGRLVRHDSEIL